MPYRPGPFQKYRMHRSNAITRGVRWDLTFGQWMTLWLESGHWLQRGKGIGKYCMARRGDVGPYAIGNVDIILFTKNVSDGQKGKTQYTRTKTFRKRISKLMHKCAMRGEQWHQARAK